MENGDVEEERIWTRIYRTPGRPSVNPRWLLAGSGGPCVPDESCQVAGGICTGDGLDGRAGRHGRVGQLAPSSPGHFGAVPCRAPTTTGHAWLIGGRLDGLR